MGAARIIVLVGVVLNVLGGVLYLVGDSGSAIVLVVLGALGIVGGSLVLGRQRRLKGD